MRPEFVDPYLYPGTDVLRNKPGLRDKAVLQQFEYAQATVRAYAYRAKPIRGKFDLDHLRAIHRYLFQDVYDWAGLVRTVHIAKGASSFALPQHIESFAATLSTQLAKDNRLKGLDKPAFIERLAHHFAEFNALHPFREGNGRATREFFGQLARDAGYEIDQTRIDNHRDQWNRACAAGHAGDLAPLAAIFAEAVRPLRAVAFDRDEPREALRKHPELQSAFATMQAAQQYAIQAIADPAARASFLERTRQRLRAQLHEGGLVPMPRAPTRDPTPPTR